MATNKVLYTNRVKNCIIGCNFSSIYENSRFNGWWRWLSPSTTRKGTSIKKLNNKRGNKLYWSWALA